MYKMKGTAVAGKCKPGAPRYIRFPDNANARASGVFTFSRMISEDKILIIPERNQRSRDSGIFYCTIGRRSCRAATLRI